MESMSASMALDTRISPAHAYSRLGNARLWLPCRGPWWKRCIGDKAQLLHKDSPTIRLGCHDGGAEPPEAWLFHTRRVT